ncbi:hypothetical protein ROG8370_02730 [Roseovarius gaetbuli]|uniref:Uncharacterized protein n=1 Tax=Roseovarius gaetbuli TaxID=1356575 RepID=A0A1X6ZRH0_9RHOB|nr:hypothetical protein ROG8370_02730 [Roseovarius gaetbuli]
MNHSHGVIASMICNKNDRRGPGVGSLGTQLVVVVSKYCGLTGRGYAQRVWWLPDVSLDDQDFGGSGYPECLIFGSASIGKPVLQAPTDSCSA